MNVVSPTPDIWWRTASGQLIPPFTSRNSREFVATDEGLIEVRCPVSTPVFNAATDEIWDIPSGRVPVAW